LKEAESEGNALPVGRAPYGIQQQLARAIARLSTREMLVLALYYCESLTFDEIGKVLACPVEEVERIYRAVLSDLRQIPGFL
jgi:RNA polymerase sigma factor (sigma-70 family)